MVLSMPANVITMDLDGPDYASECDYDVLPQTIEYNPS
jgi:hypothetical protein